jgi:hypothetical protein
MPLSDAAVWIATNGGTTNAPLDEEETWAPAFKQLLDRISSDEVEIIGRKHGAGTAEKIAGHRFAFVRVSYPVWPSDETLYRNAVTDDPLIQACPSSDEDQYLDGPGDALYVSGALEYSHLQVKKDDVARQWPFGRGVFPDDLPPTFDAEGGCESPEAIAKPVSVLSNVRKRGRRPKKREQVKEAMRLSIQEGRQTSAGLRAMLEKNLASTYVASRDTVRQARNELLSEFDENLNSDK